jgi:hypothetical protein
VEGVIEEWICHEKTLAISQAVLVHR